MSSFPLPKEPIDLSARGIELHPLELALAEPLWAVAQDPALWQFSPDPPATLAGFKHYIQQALLSRRLNVCVPFALWHVAQARYVGSTRLANMDYQHRRAEIGWTFIGAPWQRSFVNSEAKRTLLDYAFDQLKCVRVEFKCSSKNLSSRQAIERLGAHFEGTLRAHMQLPNGERRDTCYFSILREEWPALRAVLQSRCGAITVVPPRLETQ